MTTDITNDKSKKKLKLTHGKLVIGKPIENLNSMKTLMMSNASTVIEVKKSKSNIKNDLNTKELSAEELDKRINILKKAIKNNSSEEKRINTLSELANINQHNNLFESDVDVNSKQYDQDSKVEIVDDNDLVDYNNLFNTDSYNDQSVISTKFDESEKQDINLKISKNKNDTQKKLKKSDIISMLDEDIIDLPIKARSLASIKRAKEKNKRKLYQKVQEKIYRDVIIPESISVIELSNRMAERSNSVIHELIKLGINVASSNNIIDGDSAELVAIAFGHKVKRVKASDVERILYRSKEHNNIKLEHRAPIVTIMGHVDHGKTSLLDSLRFTNVALNEIGGITQNIGAYTVILENNKFITFIDTPGHEAFSLMRARGSSITDIVILVIAIDDGIKPQTLEAITHAKNANVPIIVALNKIDKIDIINIDNIKHELINHGVLAEEYGGDTMFVSISALKKINLDKLLECILLQSDMMDLKVEYNTFASGIVLEVKRNKNKGLAVTLLVQSGTLNVGDTVIASDTYGKIKSIINDKGVIVSNAIPSTPVEVYGFNDIPNVGDKFHVISDEKQLKNILDYRKRVSKEKKILDDSIDIEYGNEIFNKFIQVKELLLIIKSDTQGSMEAISNTLMKIINDDEKQKIKVKIVYSGIGPISESDVALAKASNAIIICFNVKINVLALNLAIKEKVVIKEYYIIYNLVNDIIDIISNMLLPSLSKKEVHIGTAEIRQLFTIGKIGNVAGSYVIKGIIKKGASAKVIRNNDTVYEGKIKTLKRFKDDVKEVKLNFECGIIFDNYNDFVIGDKVEVFEQEKK